ncbi:MAG: ABC transporter permease, partial [Roseateles sp.]
MGLHGAGSAQRRLQLASLATAAAAVLALAVINFVNLWSVRTLQRQREIGLRKSLGAGGPQLAAPFFVEAAVAAGLAGGLGLLLAWWATPWAEVQMQRQFHAPVLSPAMAALTALLCGVIAAVFAALAFTVLWQAQHAGALPRGFDIEDRVAVDLP